MTSDVTPKLAKCPQKGAANPKIVQNSVRASCLALLSDAACCAIEVMPAVTYAIAACTTLIHARATKHDTATEHVTHRAYIRRTRYTTSQLYSDALLGG